MEWSTIVSFFRITIGEGNDKLLVAGEFIVALQLDGLVEASQLILVEYYGLLWVLECRLVEFRASSVVFRKSKLSLWANTTINLFEKYASEIAPSVESWEISILRRYADKTFVISVDECISKVIELDLISIRVISGDDIIVREIAVTCMFKVLDILKFGLLSVAHFLYGCCFSGIICNRYFASQFVECPILYRVGGYNTTIIDLIIIYPYVLVQLIHSIDEKNGPNNDEDEGAGHTTPCTVILSATW